MSDNNPKDNLQVEEIQRLRQKKAEGFRLNISESEPVTDDTKVYGRASTNSASAEKNTSNEITSFSNEDTKAQIEKNSKKALKEAKKEEKKIRKIKANRNKKIYRIAWLLTVVILVTVTSQFFISAFNDVFAVNRTEHNTVTVVISKGDTADDVAKKLEEKGAIDSAAIFSLFLDVTGKGDDIEPGVYEVETNKDYLGVVNYLRNTGNRRTTITLQFTEGMNVQDVAEKLYDAGVTTDKEKFLELCNSNEFDKDYDFIAEISAKPERIYKLEGYLFPDTYEFYVDEDPKITISRFLDNFETKISETKLEVSGYSETMTIADLAKRSDYSLDELVNMASIVQGESANVADMYNISSVIYNRLERGSQQNIHSLGMDSTQFYPYSSAEDVPENLKDTFVSDYETYDNQGLPPGAICSPGLDALSAAVNPNSTNYFYFCHGQNSDGSVTSYYAETLSEHQNNLYEAGLL